MVWCGLCYQRDKSDNFHINELTDEDGTRMYDCESDRLRYKVGIDGAHLVSPFQCDLCLFRTLYARNPRRDLADMEHLKVIRRINLDVIWSREPSTIAKNIGYLNNLIVTCESSGFTPQLPSLGPFPFKDTIGIGLAFSMLVHSTRTGRHSKLYTQFATIRKQRSAFSNLFHASHEGSHTGMVISSGSQTSARITTCPSNSIWFGRWSAGCETRMGFILKQNRAISLEVVLGLVQSFKKDIKEAQPNSWHRQKLCMGLSFAVIAFTASLRGSEGLKVEFKTLKKLITKGKDTSAIVTEAHKVRPKHKVIPHVILPLRGRFKGEKGELCHLMPLANVSKSGLPIRASIELLVATRMEMKDADKQWAFCDNEGAKLVFSDMNDIILEQLDKLKEDDLDGSMYDLTDVDVFEEFSINRSFRRGSSTHAQNQKIPELVINAQNRWRKIEAAKGMRPKFGMIENYSEIEHLIPTAVRYSEML